MLLNCIHLQLFIIFFAVVCAQLAQSNA